jgi:heme exporter protein D
MENLDTFLHTFFQMGGYAGFVWPAYAITALGLIGALVSSWHGWKAREREFETLKRERP